MESAMQEIKQYSAALAIAALSALMSLPAQAAIDLSETPLFLSVNVEPNVILTLDDSTSMFWGFMPDSIIPPADTKNYPADQEKRFTSYSWNTQYYNPNVTYTIPTRKDGVTYATSFTAARINGFDSTKGTINLSNAYRVTQSIAPDGTNGYSWRLNTYGSTAAAAFYHLYYADKPGQSLPNNCDATRDDEDCYVYIQAGSSNDIFSGTTAEKKLNFAIWYSFYRTRAFATMSAAMSAVSSLDTNQVRLAWQTLSNCTSFGTSCKGYDSVSRENRMRTLDALKTGSSTKTHRTDFYEWVGKPTINGYTPLRSTLKRAGEYYKLSGRDSPYAEEPYITLGTELSCRKNFHILFTDGGWNKDSNDYGGNVDNTSVTLPDGVVYSPRAPYKDSSSHSLSDIAFEYWKTDLRSDLENNVNPYTIDRSGDETEQYWNPKNDQATWQHMVNFTIGLGLSNSLTDPAWGGSTYAGDYSNLVDESKSWPIVTNDETDPNIKNNVYDPWHAAINSRGQFFSADNPAAVSAAFQSVFDSILEANPSAAALAANSTSIQSGTLVYQARFDSSDWHGKLIAYSVQANGNIGNEQWDASELIPTHASRDIFTWNGSAGKTFTNCNSSLSAAQKAALDKDGYGVTDNRCTDRLAWLRGNSAQEQRNGGTFRNRTVSVLGDIINSDPAYVKDEDFGYGSATSGLTEKTSYATFVAGKATRTPMIYVGANDGMLHAIRADIGHTDSGAEIFGYIPAGVYAKLSQLTESAYSHTYFVDGPPSSGDAYLAGEWKSVVVGGLGAGGKSVYALDITDPDGFAAADVLWEYSDATDLGYTYSQPQIARLNNGEWAAIFGNGYNSTSDKAFLYIVNLADGSLIKKIAAGDSTANGLSTPALYDSDGDKIIDTVYAGDLLGNMWKFDLSAASSASWSVANSGNPVFSAVNENGEAQPITAQPEINALTSGTPSGGVMLYFGTGRYLTSTDPNDTQVQSFYAIWDNGSSTVSRSQLQVQSITDETSEFGFDIRETSNNIVDWTSQRGWYMDLVVPPTTAAGPGGERVISRPLVRYDRVIFVTVIPSTDPCVPGGSSWIMELDLLTGGRTVLSAFDFNGDGVYDDNDKLASDNVGSGVKSKVGITKTPTWLENDTTAIKELSGTSGGIMSLNNRKPAESTGVIKRIFWEQIQ